MKKTILIIGVSILILIGITMSVNKESDEIGIINQYFNFLAGEINETQILESGMNPTGSFIGTSGKNWVFNIIEEDLDVEMEIEAINETMIELTLNLINESNTPNNYKWDMALCNIEGVDNLQYMNEDAQGGFNYSVPLNVNYGNLTNYGMNSSWCDITNGLGYVLFSSGSKNQLPKHIRLILPENATEFMIYAGSGSLIMDVRLTQGTAPVSTQHLCISGGKCHGVFASSSDVHYANTTYDSATESCHASWSNKTISNLAIGDTGILCFPNESISIYYKETATNDLDMLQSDDNGISFGNAQTIADTAEAIDKISGAVDSNNDAHFVFTAVSDAWYVNLSNADSEREIATADSERVVIIVDNNNNQYIGIVEDSTDALTVMSSKDGFATRNIWQDGASVGTSDYPTLAVCGNGTLYGAWTDTADLQFCITTTSSWTTATCTEIDASNSLKASMIASKNCDPYILYDDGTNLVLANKTDGGSFSVRRTLINSTEDGSPAGVIIPSSSVPDKTLNYVHSPSTEVHYDNISIQQAPVYTLTITDPTTSSPLTNVVSGQTIEIDFNITKTYQGVTTVVTSGVTMENVTINGTITDINGTTYSIITGYAVSSSSNDGWQNVPPGAVGLTDTTLWCDVAGRWCGFRWTNVAVPQRATINAAHIELKNAGTQNVYVDIYVQNASDAPTYSTGTDDISSRNTTTGAVKVDWDAASQGAGWIFSPDISTTLQDIINHSSWVSGNAIAVIYEAQTSNTLQPLAYDNAVADGAHLNITYTGHQFAYSTEKGVWEVNVTVPNLPDGTYDLFLSAKVGDIPYTVDRLLTLNNTQSNAITYGAEAPSNSCNPTSPLTSDYVFECSDNCNQTTELNAGNYNILINGTGTFTMTADITNHNATTIKGISESEKCFVTCLGGCFRD